MKKHLTISIIVLFILSGIRLLAQSVLIKESRAVSSFSSIRVGGIAHVYLIKATSESVGVEVNSKDFNDRLVVEVVDKVLVIRMKPAERGAGQGYGKVKARINVSYKNLDKIVASGATHVYSENVIESDKLDIGSSGVSVIKLNLRTKELNMEGSGTSAVNLAGSTKALNVKATGMSTIGAHELKAEDVRLESSGASQLFITASSTLSVKASGTSGVKYKGTARVISEETSTAARVEKI